MFHFVLQVILLGYERYEGNIYIFNFQINSNDDCGILEGQWGGPYLFGEPPSHWSGSHDILLRWLNNDCHPVKFGQCWVFAGVMVSGVRRNDKVICFLLWQQLIKYYSSLMRLVKI